MGDKLAYSIVLASVRCHMHSIIYCYEKNISFTNRKRLLFWSCAIRRVGCTNLKVLIKLEVHLLFILVTEGFPFLIEKNTMVGINSPPQWLRRKIIMAVLMHLWHISVIDFQNFKRCRNFEPGYGRGTLQMKILGHMVSTYTLPSKKTKRNREFIRPLAEMTLSDQNGQG